MRTNDGTFIGPMPKRESIGVIEFLKMYQVSVKDNIEEKLKESKRRQLCI